LGLLLKTNTPPLFEFGGVKITFLNRATDWNRTSDLIITNDLLYRLSYGGLIEITRKKE
jgi:hypothetical protein